MIINYYAFCNISEIKTETYRCSFFLLDIHKQKKSQRPTRESDNLWKTWELLVSPSGVTRRQSFDRHDGFACLM